MPQLTSPSGAISIHQDDLDSFVDSVWVRPAGRKQLVEIAPSALREVDLRQLGPIRDISHRHGNQANPVFRFSTITRTLLGCESRTEGRFITALDPDPSVDWILPQPFQVRWRVDGETRHTPDFLVRHRRGECRVADVRPRGRVFSSRDAFWLTEQMCRTLGIGYEIHHGENDDQSKLDEFLRRYRIAERCLEEERDLPDHFTLRWVYRQRRPRLTSAMWFALARGDFEVVGSVTLDDNLELRRTGGGR